MDQEIRKEHILRVFEETNHPDLSHKEVANELGIHYTTARRHIKRLESEGVIHHTRSNGNTKLYDKTP